MGVASLVLGIVAVIVGFVLAPVGLVLGIVGLILGIVAIRRDEKKSVAIAGLVLSTIGILIGAIMTLLIGVLTVEIMGNPALMREIQQTTEALQTARPSVAP